MNRSRVTIINRIILWSLLALAAGLRIWDLTGKNIWLDESTSWDLATSQVSRLISWTATDIHPPLYYLILKGWVGMFGDSVSALRSLSVVASVVGLYLLYRLIEVAMPRIVAFAALFWCAVSPHAIYYAQETRMYALATTVVIGACLAYRRWIDSECTRRTPLVMYAICATTAIYLHYFTALAIAAIWVHFLCWAISTPGSTGTYEALRPRGRRLWISWLVAHVAIAVAYTPWIMTAIAQITRGQSWRQPVTIAQIPSYAAELLRMLMFGTYEYPYIRSIPGAIALGVLAIGFARLCVVAVKPKGEREAFFAVVAIVPVVLGLSLLPKSGHMDLSRYLPYAAPLLIVAGARGLSLLSLKPAHAAAIVLAGSVAVLPWLQVYYRTTSKDSDARPIVAYLLQHANHTDGERQDTIYIAPDFMHTMVRYISRRTLGYRALNVDLSFESLPEAGRVSWLIVDYRWPAFNDLDRHNVLESVDVPGNNPAMMRLFRVRAK